MALLLYPDWKRRLPFDNIVYKEVKRYSLKLNTYERELMDVQIEFYRNNFSLLQVMNHFKLLKTQEEIESFIKSILKRQDNIMHIPNLLATYFKDKIKKEFQTYKAFFDILLKKAMERKPENIYLPVAKAILGDYYKPTMKYVNRYSKMNIPTLVRKKVSPAGYENLARDYIYRCQNDITLASIFGRSSFRRNLPISVVDDYGYGEWVSKTVTYNNNRFFIYSNHSSLTDVQL